ncbi:hypothetical protein B0H34DRAFT_374481 [Crassisporium funariophilum]|nr:hypothetical protein B0H34DRAFT_374481 [Crassisporium funariophilum]
MLALRRFKNYPPQVRFASPPLPQRNETSIGGLSLPQVTQLHRTHTQEDQDKEDEATRREAMRDLVESWMDRLQLISVITTFFASTEAGLLSITTPSFPPGGPVSLTSEIANIGLMGALVVHTNAAIISFLAAFFLIRYKLTIAKNEEKQAASHDQKELVDSPTSMSPSDLERSNPALPPHIGHQTDPTPGLIRVNDFTGGRPIWSRNPHLVQVGPFEREPPTHLLQRCHSLCIFLSVLGFVLALMGMLCFAWDRLPLSVGISSSFFMGVCVVAGVVILVLPEPKEGSKRSHIYYQ